MVTSIARQSVIIKCNMQKSIMTGNYEFYYAAGLVEMLAGVTFSDEIQPMELMELLTEQLQSVEARDEREAHLFQMIRDYRPNEMYDAQMKELLLWGKTEQNLWMV